MKTKKGWHKCNNPKCRGKYHTDKNGIVDVRCRCQKESHERMLEFNREITRMAG